MATHIGSHAGEQSSSRWCRRTRGGRTIHYNLSVLQQPERARACGSGPKSSADRRPVDPPPIVRLLVSEGETPEQAKDVTMDYNSDFFLFVSLENARPMAHGRVQTPAATSPPVLTGVPVSACCYLDRPTPAGYFLFPDLSVRHEGRYRLIFRLYERNKDAQDLSMADPTEQPDSLQDEDGLFFTFLNEVRSVPFTVYSAKKFPGLAESTPLSRTVAEQGCRVRIRRDVRMRRRETKGNGPSEYEQREEYARDRQPQSPADAYRHRSLSNSSMDRRPSAYEHAPIAPNQPILNFAPPAYNKPFQPPPAAPPSEPVSPATRAPVYRQNSFAGPTYPSTPTYPPPYADRPPSSAHDDRRSSLPYPPMAQPYVTPIQPRPSLSSLDTGYHDREPRSNRERLSSILIKDLDMKADQSPATPMLPSAPSSFSLPHTSNPPSSLKRSYDEQYVADDTTIELTYRRAGGNHSSKHATGYVREGARLPHIAKIDPKLRGEGEHEVDQLPRKRAYRG